MYTYDMVVTSSVVRPTLCGKAETFPAAQVLHSLNGFAFVVFTAVALDAILVSAMRDNYGRRSEKT